MVFCGTYCVLWDLLGVFWGLAAKGRVMVAEVSIVRAIYKPMCLEYGVLDQRVSAPGVGGSACAPGQFTVLPIVVALKYWEDRYCWLRAAQREQHCATCFSVTVDQGQSGKRSLWGDCGTCGSWSHSSTLPHLSLCAERASTRSSTW